LIELYVSFFFQGWYPHGPEADLQCKLYGGQNLLLRQALSFDIFKPEYIFLCIKQWHQAMSSNRYMPGFFDNTLNLCQVYQDYQSTQDNIVKKFVNQYVPNADAEFIEKQTIIHACPYVVSVMGKLAVCRVVSKVDRSGT
jgi:hypothetical protein